MILKMVDLAQRITNLENEIEGYKKDLQDATSPEEKNLIRRLLLVSREAYVRLLDQQNAQIIGLNL